MSLDTVYIPLLEAKRLIRKGGTVVSASNKDHFENHDAWLKEMTESEIDYDQHIIVARMPGGSFVEFELSEE